MRSINLYCAETQPQPDMRSLLPGGEGIDRAASHICGVREGLLQHGANQDIIAEQDDD